MEEVKQNSTYSIHQILPEEIFVMILKKLDFESLIISRDVCKKWRNVIDGFELLSMQNFFRSSCVIIGGGSTGKMGEKLDSIEVTSGLSKTKIQLPNLPDKINHFSMFIHNGSLMFCGGYNDNLDQRISKGCYQLDKGKWKRHSALNRKRVGAQVVSTEKGTFLFGGSLSSNTYEFLPNNPRSKKWNVGNKCKIPGGFLDGSAIEVKSKQQIWLIGGMRGNICGPYYHNRILSFDISSEIFQELPIKLNVARDSHVCAFIPGTNKILIAGGFSYPYKYDNTTEIIDTEDGSVTVGGSLNIGRVGHGIGIIMINGVKKLAVFGGVDRTRNDNSSIELYNAETDQWEMADFTLNEPKFSFGYVTVKK